MTIPSSAGFFPASSCLPCTPEEEKEIILELIKASDANLKEGDVFYLISSRWWRSWREYVRLDEYDGLSSSSEQPEGYIPHRPGEIDNMVLILNVMNRDGGISDIQRNLLEGTDYDLVPEEVWKKLLEWYNGGPEIPRKLISDGLNGKNFVVEVYPLCLCLVDGRDNSQRGIRISRKATVGKLYEIVCSVLKLDLSKVIIWDYYNKNKGSMIIKLDETLDEVALHMDQEILLEIKPDELWPSSSEIVSTGNELALVPIEPSRTSVAIAGGRALSNGHAAGFGSYLLQGNSYSSSLSDIENVESISSNGGKVDGIGLTGLHNLGNTCFMNSAIQCLVHTPPLVEFFLQDYSEEINEQNPLGMQGELAIAFGELLRKLWRSGRSSVAPREFKGKLARFAPQFSGYNQHDSQELLAFLLDGLHEDLNRVKSKPYIEAKDANGHPDGEFADECWGNHKARNDSVIVDICQGQYKSTLVCPICNKVSVTFDPFMYLSLPLPSTITRQMTITVFSSDGSALPMPYTVTVSKNGRCKDLIQALSTACCLRSSESLLVAEVHDHRIYRYMENMLESLSTIKDEDHIVAYRLPSNHREIPQIQIFHRSVEKCSTQFRYNSHQELLGAPLVMCLTENYNSGADVHAAVRAALTPLLRSKTQCLHHQAKSSKDNDYRPSLDGVTLTDNSAVSNGSDTSPTAMEIDSISNGFSTFQLVLTNDSGVNGLTIDDDKDFLVEGKSIKVYLDWSHREHDLYDSSYLDHLPGVYNSGNQKTGQEAVSLFSCMDAFLKEEPLGPDDMWYCPTCKEHRQATKKLDLWRLPEILVVHLKRFSYSRYMKNKLDTFVNFPVHNLDLNKYLKHKPCTTESYVYELYAISNHYGGLGGGHYSAYAKLIGEDSWYHFDDSHVSPVNEDSIKTSAAYVLFYQRSK
ncbi:ubiquitin carboxyl-terminal hydrolase 9-like [Dioscorea cayenensis subsp. rotundata]|uniref:Ubiquitin carboxyl-terminal hydrolase n=1 Tax=Dioscorea cayennensis subsp. rotundata TaxID=55577 RepID=A0AB40CDU8_DIOCR|nr:ubiquitin carboxyl-terminal hydrolase 9-like [Dioscorea cayenensis subsp. rotundata]